MRAIVFLTVLVVANLVLPVLFVISWVSSIVGISFAPLFACALAVPIFLITCTDASLAHALLVGLEGLPQLELRLLVLVGVVVFELWGRVL